MKCILRLFTLLAILMILISCNPARKLITNDKLIYNENNVLIQFEESKIHFFRGVAITKFDIEVINNSANKFTFDTINSFAITGIDDYKTTFSFNLISSTNEIKPFSNQKISVSFSNKDSADALKVKYSPIKSVRKMNEKKYFINTTLVFNSNDKTIKKDFNFKLK